MNIAGIVPPIPRPGHNDYHVVPAAGRGWVIKQENSQFWHISQTQLEAIGYGIELARGEAVSLLVHGRDGSIRDVYFYGKRA